MKNYVVYHLHSDLSLLDSCTQFEDYVDKAVGLGQTAIASTEHGKPLQWVKKKMYCDKKGIKFIYGVECYLTETISENIRDNYHSILLAKNLDGIKEINAAITKSCDENHSYYVNRLTFDEFLSLSPNVITTSACLASPLNKLGVSHSRYAELIRRYDYLEIQHHNHPEQIAYNVHLAALAQKYNKPLIAGTDTHSLNQYKAECRAILLKAKHKSYGDEDSFDLTYKNYNELVEAYKEQGALPESVYLQAIENTNILAEQIEDFELDTSLKYPILYGTREKDREMFEKTIKSKFADKLARGIIPQEQKTAFEEAIAEELRVFQKIGMDGFMLSMSELITWCHENGIPTGNARGSVGGSRIAYVTDIIDLNPETWHTVFSRFCNEHRVEVGDIDIDCIESDRPKIFEHIVQRFGSDKTARVPSFGTIQSKGTIKEIGRALDLRWIEAHTDDTNPSGNSPYALKKIDKVISDFEKDEQLAREKYPDILYYYDGLLGTKISQSVHPAGIVISPVTLPDNYGLFLKDGENCMLIDMEEIHEIGLVKYDFLILSNIKIIQDTYKAIGKPYPRSDEIDWDDEKVWEDMIKNPIGIFQMEGEFAHSLLRKYKPRSIFDMSLVTACVRPSGTSYRERLISRQPNVNPSPIIDELLKDNNGYLVYQEDTIKFLQEICGLSGGDADNVRRAIGRKDEERLSAALPQILDGYCSKSPQPREVAEQEAQEFIQILKDSASYQFGYNHAIAYCLIGYMCAYLRFYHPIEFITAYLNNAANDDDIINGTALAGEYGIVVTPPKFGISRDNYSYDAKNKTIAKGVSSIKYLNKAVTEELFEASLNVKSRHFTDLLLYLKDNSSMDSRQLNILIRINFFSTYGNIKELLRIVEMFDFFKQGDAKSIKKDKLNETLDGLIKPYATDVGKNDKVLKSYAIVDMTSILHSCEEYIKSLKLTDLSLKLRIQDEIELLGYISTQTNKPEDRKTLVITDVIPLNGKNGEPWAYAVSTKSLGSGKSARVTVMARVYNKNKFDKGSIIKVDSISKNAKGYWYIDSYQLLP